MPRKEIPNKKINQHQIAKATTTNHEKFANAVAERKKMPKKNLIEINAKTVRAKRATNI